jgi:hypothetical protein
MGRVSLRKIEEDVSLLSSQEQLLLVERLIHRMRTAKPASQTVEAAAWDELYGLGKGVWQGQDAQEHVTNLREDR